MTNSFPTPLNPWYVILLTDGDQGLAYYSSMEENEEMYPWSDRKKDARLFLNIHSAIQTLKSYEDQLHVHLVTLWDQKQMKEYGR